MDRFLTLFGPLAWPLATLLIALIFRRDVARALGRIGQFKYRDLEVTFRDDLHQAEELARSIPSRPPASAVVLEVEAGEPTPLVGQLIGNTPSPPSLPQEDHEALRELAARSPREAVEVAWGLVDRGLVRAALISGDRRASGPSNPGLAVRYLVARGRLAGPEGMLIGLLRTLRDRSARLDRPSPTPDESRRFVELALRMVSRLEEQS